MTSRTAVRLDSLTGLRFFAALLVFFHHTFSASIVSHGLARVPGVEKLSLAGESGVTFFFVLSGFVLAWSWDGTRSAAGFLGRRLSRVWPLHAVTFVVALALLPAIGRAATGAPQAVSGLLLLQAWTTKPTWFFGGNAPSWSLSCELFFYASMPLLVPVLRRLGRRAWLAVVAGAVVWLAVVPVVVRLVTVSRYSQLAVWVFPPYRIGEFVIGVVAGLALRSGWRPPWSLRTALLVMAVAYVVAAETLGGLFHDADVSRRAFGNLWVDLVVVLPAAGLILAAAARDSQGPGTPALLAAPLVQRLGEDSFALYLVHTLVILTVAELPFGLHAMRGLPATAFALVVSLVLADLLHRRVERPAEKALRRRIVAHENNRVVSDAAPAS